MKIGPRLFNWALIQGSSLGDTMLASSQTQFLACTVRYVASLDCIQIRATSKPKNIIIITLQKQRQNCTTPPTTPV